MSSTIPASHVTAAHSQGVALLNRLFPPPRRFGLRLWDGTELPAVGRLAFRLVLKHPRALRRLSKPPLELALAEAFIYGDCDIEGEVLAAGALLNQLAVRDFGLTDLGALLLAPLTLPPASPTPLTGRAPARWHGPEHSLERDRAAAQFHTGLGDEFYGLWLDSHRHFAAGCFPTGQEDLEAAQAQRLEQICQSLRLQPGERLLDLNCGWGGLALYAAQQYGVRVLGVTLSEHQADYANLAIVRAGLGHQASVKQRDYREIGGESFDKIVSRGMFTPVGARQLPEYFAQAYRLLKPGGVFLHEAVSHCAPRQYAVEPSQKLCCPPSAYTRKSSSWQNLVHRYLIGPGQFVDRYVFPGTEFIPLNEAAGVAAAAGFEVRRVESLRDDYALTLRQWLKRLEARQTEAVQTAGTVADRTWRLYLAAWAQGFAAGQLQAHQIWLARPAPAERG